MYGQLFKVLANIFRAGINEKRSVERRFKFHNTIVELNRSGKDIEAGDKIQILFYLLIIFSYFYF